MSGTTLNFHVEGCSIPNWTRTDRRRSIAFTGDYLTWNGISTFGRPFPNKMETSQVSLATENLPSLQQAPRLGMDRAVFLDLAIEQTQGRRSEAAQSSHPFSHRLGVQLLFRVAIRGRIVQNRGDFFPVRLDQICNPLRQLLMVRADSRPSDHNHPG